MSDSIVRAENFLPQVLVEIFCRVDSPRTLILSCSLVCHQWLEILLTRYFWIAYIKRNYNYELPVEFRGDETLDLRRWAVFRCFNRNLIENPSGEKGFINWQISDNGGDKFTIERPPIGCCNPPNQEIKCAFATSFALDLKHTIVDLHNIGEAFLDKVLPPIVVSDYYTARFDCGSIYVFKVMLLTTEEMKHCIGSSLSAFDLKFARLKDVTTKTYVVRIRHLERYRDSTWQKIEHTFTNYPPGIRYVFFEHGGLDKMFWKGHYGAKMAKASVIVRLP